MARREKLSFDEYRTPRPFKVGTRIDDTFETKCCVLYMFFHFLWSKNLDIRNVLQNCGVELQTEKIQKIAIKEGCAVPKEWNHGQLKSLEWDLRDIHEFSLAEFVEGHTI